MTPTEVLLPDGTPFPFWDDGTAYKRVYHVGQRNRNASDRNPGTKARPFKTIGRAAQVLKPGEKVIVHAGIYRECVRPARGGVGPEAMIAYETAPGEVVIVRGSEVWAPAFRPSEGWGLKPPPGKTVWMADLPSDWFNAYNPFLATNVFTEFMTFHQAWSVEETHLLQLRRGTLFSNGIPLKQVFRARDLIETSGAFWVEDPGLRIHLRLANDADPRKTEIEATVREQIFAPAERELGYIRVSGFRFEHCADGVPVPQRAAVSTSRGHHWIIEKNTVRHCNGCGIDVGGQHWSMEAPKISGGHIVRGNHVSDCGVCGIAGVKHMDHALVEDNIVERIGGVNVERIYECAGMKFHVADGMLIRRNAFRHIRHACGLWLDYLNKNCRVTENLFRDISTFAGAAYLEVNHALMLVDRNIFWDIRGEVWDRGKLNAEITGGHGLKADASEYLIAAHNVFGKIKDGYALCLTMQQNQREVGGRNGLCRQIEAYNNIVVETPKQVMLGRTEENRCDGNLYDAAHDRLAFAIEHPQPKMQQNFRGWREFFGFDERGASAKIEATFDPRRNVFTLKLDGDAPESFPVAALHDDAPCPPGPFSEGTWMRVLHGGRGAFALPAPAEAPHAGTAEPRRGLRKRVS